VHSFTARMPLLTTTSAVGLGRRRWSCPQQCYLHCLCAILSPYHVRVKGKRWTWPILGLFLLASLAIPARCSPTHHRILYAVHWAGELPFPVGDLEPHPTQGSVSPDESALQTDTPAVQPFLHRSPIYSTQLSFINCITNWVRFVVVDVSGTYFHVSSGCRRARVTDRLLVSSCRTTRRAGRALPTRRSRTAVSRVSNTL